MKTIISMLKGFRSRRRPNACVAKKKLRVESLEDRRLLSVTNLAFDEVAPFADEAPAISGAVEDATPETIAFNLADYASFHSFVLDASADSDAGGANAILSGVKADGELETLSAVPLNETEIVQILGQTDVAETLTITGSAATSLDEIVFDGGDVRRDKLVVQGADGDDVFTLDSEVASVTAPLFANNPYEKLFERYSSLYGANNPIYERLVAVYEAVYAQLQQRVVVKTATMGVVQLENGAEIKFDGALDVEIDAGAGRDTYKINSLGVAYTLVGGADEDALDFSDADGALNLDMGARSRQAAIVGDLGTLRLGDDFELVLGSSRSDRFVGDRDGSKFIGNGGRDSVNFIGGVNEVELKGAGQSIVVRGGKAEIRVENGDNSVVNVVGNAETEADIDATGDRIRVVGVGARVDANVDGDFAQIFCGAASEASVFVEGSFAKVVGGAGDDVVTVDGNWATINAGAGNDEVTLVGAFANVFLGSGDDFAIVGDNGSGRVGSNYVSADAGNDLIVADGASGDNRFNAGRGDDVIIGSAGDDVIYATSGDNVLIGLGGEDRLFGGVGRDVLIGSQPSKLFERLAETGLESFYAELYENWAIDADLEATIELLGEVSVADGERDWLYRGGGKRNLLYANQSDRDFANALDVFAGDDVCLD